MALEARFSPKRLIFVICIFLSAIFTDIFLVNITRTETYGLIGLISGSLILVLLGVVWLEYDRTTHKYSEEKFGNFCRIFIVFVAGCVIVTVCALMGLDVAPFSVISMAFSLITEPTTGVIFGTYFSFLYNSVVTMDYRYFILYLILVVVGAAVARLFADKDTIAGGGIIVICSYVLCCTVTQFVVQQRFGVLPVVYSMALGIVSVAFGLILGWYVTRFVDNRQQIQIQRLLDPNSKVCAAWKNHSPKQYKYCLKVAELAYEAAGYIGADAALAKAGGIFCRIGLMSGNELVKSNVEVGEHYNFPTNLIQLIYETADRSEFPTMKEAAIVIMADRCVRAFVKMETDDAKVGWNREIVLQQLFNNATTEGLLDACGISYKEYLSIKDSFSRKLGDL
ncbi:MAG: hypothetical protein IK152_05100 [Lachnospiraceae bacterium]|nr:hypothetical protein [Lachnospiraceae bacterium]